MAELDPDITALDITALARLVENVKVDAPQAYANLSRWMVARRLLILAALERGAEAEEELAQANALLRVHKGASERLAERVERVEAAGVELADMVFGLASADRREARRFGEMFKPLFEARDRFRAALAAAPEGSDG